MTAKSAPVIEPLDTGEFLRVEDGAIRVKGRRIGIEHIVRYYDEGYTPEEIAAAFSRLDVKIVYGVIAYYLQNREAVDAYIAGLDADVETGRAEWAHARSDASLKVESALRARGIYRSGAR